MASALPRVTHELCHFHYLREAARPLYEADRHAKKELKKRVRGIRPIERQVQGRSDREAPAIRGYCSAVRSAITASFHGKLRDELLNAELFADLREAKALAAAPARWVSDSVATRSPISASLKLFCSSELCRRSFLSRHTPAASAIVHLRPHSLSDNIRWSCTTPRISSMHSGRTTQIGVRYMSFELILIWLIAFVLINVVYYEFARPKLQELRRRFRQWMFFDD